MANKTRSFLKTKNTNFNNILDSVELAIRENSSPTGTATTLTNEDSGKLLLVNPASATTITMPAIGNVGFHVDIVLTEGVAATDGSMAAIVNVSFGQGDNIGQVHEVDGTAGNFMVTGDDFFVFTADSTPGDRISCVSTGTQWIAQAYVKDLSDSDFSANATTIA